jgi:flavorubredoxin/NADPH-dependent 2,4-dienoyl-CoA reductase/sulfur reductase-like enzyme/rubredoxin
LEFKSLEIKKNLYWVGALDPDLRVFDIIMYTPFGTTYNAYVLKGSEKTALFETVKDKTLDQYLERLKDLQVDVTKVDYLVVSHTEPDHAGSVEKILELAPNIKIIASENAVKYLKEIVNRDFDYIIVNEGDTISLGDKTLEFLSVPMLHWPDTIYTYVKEDKTLITCDSFGSHYSSEKIVNNLTEQEDKDYLTALKYYYDNILGPFKPSMINAIEKIKAFDIETICPGHGPVLVNNPQRIVDFYYDWSKNEQLQLEDEVTICYVSAYGYTKTIAEVVKKYIEEHSSYKVNIFDMVTAKKEEYMPKIISSKGLLLGTPTILGDALPPVWEILVSLNPVLHGEKVASAFGSYGWSGEAVVNVMERLEQLRMNTVDPCIINFKPSEENLQFVNKFAEKFVTKLKHTFTVKKSNIKYKCIVCNEIFDGPQPPKVCPVCGAKEDQFIEIYDEEITYKNDTNENYAIIGNGAAGFYAADAIRKRNNTCEITMLTDEDELSYYRPSLSDGINANLEDDFYLANCDWYKENNVNVMLSTKVTKIDDKASKLIYKNESEEKELHYDKLIIATGSHCFVPNMEGSDLESVYALRNKADLEKIKLATEKASKAVVIGGGLLGLEAAWEFKLKGLDVTVVEAMPEILTKQLDRESSRVISKCIADSGVEIITNGQVSKIEKIEETNKTRVVLKSGETIDTDLVLFSIGVRSNIEIAKGTEIKTDRGIVVDKTMKTSVDNIYACGDVAQVGENSYALWATSMDMGKVAGANACGDEKVYEYTSLPVALDAMGADMISIGDVRDYNNSVTTKDVPNRKIKKLMYRDEKLVGAVMINNNSDSVKLMREINKF